MKSPFLKMLGLILGIIFLPNLALAQWDPTTLMFFGLPNQSIFDIITNILAWLLAILGIVGVIGFLIAGILYLTSAGDKDQIDRAKRAMTYSIIGIIVGLSGVVAIRFAQSLLSAQSF